MIVTIDSKDYSDKMHVEKMIHCNDLWMIINNNRHNVKIKKLIKEFNVEHLFKE